MIRKTSILLGLVAILALNACGGEPAAMEIVEAMTEAMGAVDTYQYEVNLDFNATGEEASEPIETSMTMDLSGASDLASRMMQADITMEASRSGEDPDISEVGMEMYLVDDVMYIHARLPEMGGLSMWLKTEIPEEYWGQMNQVESQMELAAAAEVTLTGSEKVGSVDCYVLELVPDMDQLWETMMAQGHAAGDVWPEMPFEGELPDISSFSVRQWVAKDTYYLMKAEITMAMSAPLGTAGVSGTESDVDVEMSVSITMHDYNVPVSIELPEEAEDAIDMDAFGGFLDRAK